MVGGDPDVDRDRRHHRRHARAHVRQAPGVVPRRRRPPRRIAGATSSASAMTELPTVKQGAADQLSGVRGGGVVAERVDLRTGDREPTTVRPSSATDLEHGFGGLAKFFVPGKADARRAGGGAVPAPRQPGRLRRRVHLLRRPAPRAHRPAATASSPTSAPSSTPGAYACHPYDVCTAMLLEEAGGVVTDPWGGPLDAPLDTTSPIAWVGYANPTLAARIGPVLAELVDEHSSAVAPRVASTSSGASPTTRARWCSRRRPGW